MRRGAFGVAALLSSGLLALALAELAVRLVFPPSTVAFLRDRSGAPIDSFYIETEGGRRLRPSSVLEFVRHRRAGRPFRIETNSMGFRGPELGAKTHPRLLFVGDSITMGSGVDQEETYVERIAQLSASGPSPVQTINAGVGGDSIFDELSRLEETGLATEPDAVVLNFYLNDASPCCARRVLRAPAPLRRSWLAQAIFRKVDHFLARDFEHSDLPDETFALWRKEIVQRAAPGGATPDFPPEFRAELLEHARDWGSAWSDGAWVLMRPAFARLRELADRHDFQLAIVAFPPKIQAATASSGDFPQRQLAAIAAELGIPFFDVLPHLREQERDTLDRFFWDHCHFTRAGHEFVAQLLFDFVEDALSLKPVSPERT